MTDQVTVTVTDEGPIVIDVTPPAPVEVNVDALGKAGPRGRGFTSGSYNASTGVVTFASDDGLGFSTGDLRGEDGDDGDDGWAPVFTLVSDGARRVLEISDWVGGQGAKPGTGFVGASGVVATAAEAADVRGAAGSDGNGWTGATYDAATGVITFTSDDGLEFDTGDLRGVDGEDGWSPILAVVADGARQVLRVTDWAGGEGTKPGTGDYLSATGLDPDIANAIDISGTDGDDGEDAWSPVFGIASDGARRVLQVADWTGGEGTKPDTGDYVGPTGFVSVIGSAVDIRGPEGEPGAGSGDMQASTYDPQGIADDAFARSNHTGTQAQSTIVNLETDLAAKADASAVTSELAGKQDVLAEGAFVDGDKNRLDGMADNATANASDADLRDRSTHTGEQAQSTITNLPADLAAKAPLASPALTGTPTAPTATGGTNTTQISTTAFVQAAVSAAINALIDAAPGTLDTLDELAAALGDDPNFAATVNAAIAARQIILSEGAFTDGDKTKLDGIAEEATKNATDAALRDRATHSGEQAQSTITGLVAALAAKAALASPTFTGTPAAPTASGGTNTTQIATTAFVQAAAALLLSKSGGAMTGDLTVKGVKETPHDSSATSFALNPSANGTRGTLTLVAETTLTDSMVDREGITLRVIDGDLYTLNFVAGTLWVGGVPTLTGDDFLRFEKWGTDLIGFYGLGIE